MNDDATLEHALTSIEREVDATVKALSSALREAKKAKAAAAVGKLRDLRQALDGAALRAAEAATVTREASNGWTFDEQDYFASGAYDRELLATAKAEGVQAFESDDRILCYPAIVSTSATDTSVVIDKKKERRVRPSVVVRLLAALQSRPPKFRPEAFLEALAAAYDLAAARRGTRPGATVKLADVYRVLTVLPGSARDYSKPEFARDLYLLDQSGVTTTRDGRVLSLPASALTRGSGVLTTVTRGGQEKVYAGISFAEVGP